MRHERVQDLYIHATVVMYVFFVILIKYNIISTCKSIYVQLAYYIYEDKRNREMTCRLAHRTQ